MKKSILSLATVAALTGTLGFGFHASAHEVTVEKGDTLWGIANTHHISVENLKDWNNLSSELIFPNDRLKVANKETYEVKKGDTLSCIASQYDGVTWKMIQEWNDLDSDLIVIGQTLDIYIQGKGKSSTPASTDIKESVETTEIVEKELETNEEPNTEENNSSSDEESVPSTVSAEPAEESASTTEEPVNEEVAQELTMSATAYTATCEGCTGITATGINLLDNPDKKVISVDPSVIPLGSEVYVEGYGHAIAGDTGGAIVGNKIDIFIPNKDEAINWGVQDVKVTVYK